MRRAILYFLVLALLINGALAASLSIEAPQYIVENEDTTVHVVLNSSITFSGNVTLAFSNLNSLVTAFPFSESNLAPGFYNYSFILEGIIPGSYQIIATAANSSGDTVATATKTGTVNSSIPIVLSSSPSGFVSKDSILLSVRTNEVSSCKFDTSNTSYPNMSSTFSNTNSIFHNHTVSSLSQGEKNYFVRCQDTSGYLMQDSHKINFNIDLPPSAEIELSDETPVKAGIIEVELVISESVEAPLLEYQYNDGGAKKQISLSGSGARWNGFIIITESEDNKIGTLYFSATDSAGNIGTKITNGNVFVVDTKKPSPPASIKANSEPDGRVRLTWHYDGEDADYFKIYRSTASGVNFVDYYGDSNGSSHFTDRSTIDKVTYFYKVTTVDEAGNEGALSEEVYATSINGATQTSSTQGTTTEIKKVLPPGLFPFVEDEIKKVESLIIDVLQAEEAVKGIHGEEKEILNEIGAEQTLSSSKTFLESIIRRLEGMKQEYATESELLAKLEDVNIELRRIEQTTPKSAKLIEKSDFAQTTSTEDIEKAVRKAFGSSFSEEQISEYITRNDKEKGKVKVDTSVRVFEITYLDDSKSEKSWIRKNIAYTGKQMPSDVLVIETVPKSVAEHSSELNFGSQLAEVIDSDPVIKFGYHEFSEEGEKIYYFLEKRISPDDVKNSKTVFLLNINSFAIKNEVTGNSIFNLEGFSLPIQSMLMWIGATLVLGIFGYYYVYVRVPLSGRITSRTHESIEREAEQQPFKNYIHHETDEIFEELSSHMKEVKAEMADKLLPLFVALNQKIESKKSSKNSATDYQMLLMNALIDQAHGYIDNNLHHEAVKIYPRISDLYRKLSKGQRDDIFERCSHLHRRIHFKRPF